MRDYVVILSDGVDRICLKASRYVYQPIGSVYVFYKKQGDSFREIASFQSNRVMGVLEV